MMIIAQLLENGKASNIWLNQSHITFIKPDSLAGRKTLKVFLTNGTYIDILDNVATRKQIDCVENKT